MLISKGATSILQVREFLPCRHRKKVSVRRKTPASTTTICLQKNNFETVATAIIALIFFKESVSKRLWFAITLMTIASIPLSIEQDDIAGVFRFSYGSLAKASHLCS